MDIKELFAFYAAARNVLVHKRPWAHHTKKGPGRKHQQAKTLTKEERSKE